MSSRSSRSPTPLNVEPNPYRLPRFWRGYALGVATPFIGYGLYKLGAAARNYLSHRQSIPTPSPTPIPTPTPVMTPTPAPTPEYHYHRHY